MSLNNVNALVVVEANQITRKNDVADRVSHRLHVIQNSGKFLSKRHIIHSVACGAFVLII